MKQTRLSLEQRKSLSVAALAVRSPAPAPQAVFVVRAAPMPLLRTRSGKEETREQAELRRLRVEEMTRRAPQVVITRKWTHATGGVDAQSAVTMRIPLWERLRLWLRGE